MSLRLGIATIKIRLSLFPIAVPTVFNTSTLPISQESRSSPACCSPKAQSPLAERIARRKVITEPFGERHSVFQLSIVLFLLYFSIYLTRDICNLLWFRNTSSPSFGSTVLRRAFELFENSFWLVSFPSVIREYRIPSAVSSQPSVGNT